MIMESMNINGLTRSGNLPWAKNVKSTDTGRDVTW